MNKHNVSGSYTVEAALLFPCVLFIVIGLLYLGFYMHDKVRIQSILNQAATKSRALIRNEAAIDSGAINYEEYLQRGFLYFIENDLSLKKEEIANYLENKLNNGLFLAKIETIVVTVTLSNVHMEVSASMQIPFFEVRNLFLKSGFNIKHSNNTEFHNPVEFIRIFEVFTGVTDKIEAVDKVLKKLQKILSSIR